jgi:hypothetical protein
MPTHTSIQWIGPGPGPGPGTPKINVSHSGHTLSITHSCILLSLSLLSTV